MLMITEVRSDINPAAVVSEGCTQKLQLKHIAQIKYLHQMLQIRKKSTNIIDGITLLACVKIILLKYVDGCILSLFSLSQKGFYA